MANQKSLLDTMVQELSDRTNDEKEAKSLVKNIVDEVIGGRVHWKKNVAQTVEKAIEELDVLVSAQLAKVMHHPEFQQLEGSWRGLNMLIRRSDLGTHTNMFVEVLDISKEELHEDLTASDSLNQSEMYKKVYYQQYDMGGGKPYGVMIGDYAFANSADDLETLDLMGKIGERAFCPFISSAAPDLLGLKKYSELPNPDDLGAKFEAATHAQWRSLRGKPHARYIGLTLPRVVSRLPYGPSTKKVKEFNFKEVPTNGDHTEVVSDDQYCWSNAAYSYGTLLTNAFAETGWYSRIRGQEGGGKVEDLHVHTVRTNSGDIVQNCPTEINIWYERDKELSDAGFLPLHHFKGSDYAVFDSGQSIQKPVAYDDPAASSSAQLSARMPYVLVTSRIAHYLKVLAHRWVGTYKEGPDLQEQLQRWIMQYVSADENPSEEVKALKPLKEARVEITPDPDNPGSYQMQAFLRPWYQFEELQSSLQLVSRIPKSGKG
ncbi:MAG: type VI secretion system contractile sheath large subunit [Planctomycetota bacterium]